MATAPCPAFCGCCTPAASPAPAFILNRPGLPQIVWAPGDWARFRQAMVEAIGNGPRNPADPDDPRWPAEVRAALAGLTTRDDDDQSLLLVNLFAAMADILAFHSERIANEMFLGTATARDSLLRLVRLIGYHPAPGSAATVSLAFTVAPGDSVRLRRRLKVMSVPGQDEAAQTFETLVELRADSRLNALPVYGAPSAAAPFRQGDAVVPLLGRPSLARGDALVMVAGNAMELNRVAAIDQRPDGEALRLERACGLPGAATAGFKLLRELRLFGHDLPGTWQFYDTNPALPAAKRWITRVAGTDYGVGLAAGHPAYALDRKYDDLRTGALLLVDLGPSASPRFSWVTVASTFASQASFGPLGSPATFMTLVRVDPLSLAPIAGTGLPAIADLRATRVFELDIRPVVPARITYPANVSGSTIWLRRDHLDDPALLERGRAISIGGGPSAHIAAITGVTLIAPLASGDPGHIQLGIEPPMPSMPRATPLSANVTSASHGETVPAEPLGHGMAAQPFQRFKLGRKPLTRIAAGAPLPIPELEIRVNGELWREAASLYAASPGARVYTVRTGDDGTSTIGFGDGTNGARLPSGAANIIAEYRTGLGSTGRVRSGQISTLLERPPGLAGVTNPLPADGGIDPEPLSDVRRAAPASVITFGRAVALADHAAVARESGLVIRAHASRVWTGLEDVVHLSVLAPGGGRLSADGMTRLSAALNAIRVPNQPLLIGQVWRVPLCITARLLRDPAFRADEIDIAARTALTALLSLEAWPLGRSVHLSAISAALQAVPGIVAADIDGFRIKGSNGWTAAERLRRGATAAAVQPHVRLFDARPLAGAALDPLALVNLALDPDSLVLPAELPLVENPASDLSFSVVDRL